MLVLEAFKDDLESFKLFWRFVQYETVKQFREKYPDYEYTKKSEEELVWEKLDLYLTQGKIPEDGESLISDIIRVNIGEKVSNKEFQDHLIFIDTFKNEFHDSNFNFDQHDGILSGGKSLTTKLRQYPNVLKAIQKIGQRSYLARLGGKNA